MTPEQLEKEIKRIKRRICCSSSGGGDVASVFGRTGAIVAVSGDYDFSEIGNTPTTLSGYGITDAQPLDGDLTAIAALVGTSGLARKTAANTWSLDTNTYITGLNINQLGAASSAATINNAANALEWQWNTLAGGNGLFLSSTSTVAASDTQTLFRVALSGANGTAGQFTTAIAGTNIHTGSTSENVGVYGSASGGTYNYSGWFNEQLSVGGASISAGASSKSLMIRQLTNTGDDGIIIYPNANYGTSLSLGFGQISGSGQLIITSIGGDLRLNSTAVCLGGTFLVDASALVESQSTAKGWLPPRMTTTQKNAISSPAEGLIVYDTTLHKLCVRAAAAWETITSI